MTALEMISNYGINTSNIIHAVHTINEAGRLTREQYQERINELLMEDLTFDDDDQARLYYMYTVQEFVRAGDVPADVVKKDVDARVADFNQNMSWVFETDDKVNGEGGEPKTDAAGNPKQKKGAKKEIAKKVWEENKDKGYTRKQFIQLLVEQVGLTQAGASTYYSNLKAGRY